MNNNHDDVFFPPEGIISFCHSPIITPGDKTDADVVVLGIPWDGGTGLRPGARHGPRAIREASLRVALWDHGVAVGYWDIDSGCSRLSNIQFVDAGDVPVVRASPDMTAITITETARSAKTSGKILVTLGGDHSISLPVLKAFDDVPEIGIIQLDAHLDYSDCIQGIRYNSSTSMRRISELPNIGSMVAIGLRGFRTNPEAYKAAKVRGNHLITRNDLLKQDIPSIIANLPEIDNVYVTIDIDVLDPQLAPGVSGPEMNGLNYLEFKTLLREIAKRYHIIGLDLVETSPPFDPSGLTAQSGMQGILELLSEYFEHKKHPL